MKTCLIVDDSPPVRAVAAKLLSALGLEIREAGSGGEALDICRATLPDSILLDWNMPEMSGLEFLNRLNASLPKSQLPKVVFCTGESSVAKISDALAAGAQGYIMKPFDRALLESTFRNLDLLS